MSGDAEIDFTANEDGSFLHREGDTEVAIGFVGDHVAVEITIYDGGREVPCEYDDFKCRCFPDGGEPESAEDCKYASEDQMPGSHMRSTYDTIDEFRKHFLQMVTEGHEGSGGDAGRYWSDGAVRLAGAKWKLGDLVA